VVTREVEAFVKAALPAPPARVLEIGAGRGELAVALGEAGYAMTAVDPAAEHGGIVQPRSVLELQGSFDAAVSVVALHHIDPLAESASTLRRCLLPARRG